MKPSLRVSSLHEGEDLATVRAVEDLPPLPLLGVDDPGGDVAEELGRANHHEHRVHRALHTDALEHEGPLLLPKLADRTDVPGQFG